MIPSPYNKGFDLYGRFSIIKVRLTAHYSWTAEIWQFLIKVKNDVTEDFWYMLDFWESIKISRKYDVIPNGDSVNRSNR